MKQRGRKTSFTPEIEAFITQHSQMTDKLLSALILKKLSVNIKPNSIAQRRKRSQSKLPKKESGGSSDLVESLQIDIKNDNKNRQKMSRQPYRDTESWETRLENADKALRKALSAEAYSRVSQILNYYQVGFIHAKRAIEVEVRRILNAQELFAERMQTAQHIGLQHEKHFQGKLNYIRTDRMKAWALVDWYEHFVNPLSKFPSAGWVEGYIEDLETNCEALEGMSSQLEEAADEEQPMNSSLARQMASDLEKLITNQRKHIEDLQKHLEFLKNPPENLTNS